MTQKGELVLTASPGGQRGPRRGDSFTAHLLSRGPCRKSPWMASKTESTAPKPRAAQLQSSFIHSSRHPRASAGGIKCQRCAGRQAATSPTLFTSLGQEPREKQRESRSTPPRTRGPELPPTRPGWDRARLLAAFSAL